MDDALFGAIRVATFDTDPKPREDFFHECRTGFPVQASCRGWRAGSDRGVGARWSRATASCHGCPQPCSASRSFRRNHSGVFPSSRGRWSSRYSRGGSSARHRSRSRSRHGRTRVLHGEGRCEPCALRSRSTRPARPRRERRRAYAGAPAFPLPMSSSFDFRESGRFSKVPRGRVSAVHHMVHVATGSTAEYGVSAPGARQTALEFGPGALDTAPTRRRSRRRLASRVRWPVPVSHSSATPRGRSFRSARSARGRRPGRRGDTGGARGGNRTQVTAHPISSDGNGYLSQMHWTS